MTGTTNVPSLGVKPEIKIEMPKEGTTTQYDGEVDQLSGIVVSPTGITMNGLPSGTTEPADLSVGNMWIDTTDADNVLKIKT